MAKPLRDWFKEWDVTLDIILPRASWRTVCHALRKIAGEHIGTEAGVDIVEEWAREHRLCFLPDSALKWIYPVGEGNEAYSWVIYFISSSDTVTPMLPLDEIAHHPCITHAA